MYNIIERIKKYKKLSENGELVIPFVSFPKIPIPGIEKGTYYLITASSGVGKSRLTRRIFLHDVLEYYLKNESKIKLKIIYFSLEEAKERIWMSIVSNILYKNYKIEVSIRDLSSKFKPIDNKVIKYIEKIEPILTKLNNVIEIYDDVRNSTEMAELVLRHFKKNGKEVISEKDGIEYVDEYIPNDENSYTIIITDHIGLLDYKTQIKTEIEKWSNKYCIKFRNKYNATIVNIQQQAAAGESIENLKAYKLEPSYTNLAESKLTYRDCDICIGLFSPHKHEIPMYRGYNINTLANNYRYLTLIKDRDGDNISGKSLYFNGRIEMFNELPNKTEIDKLKNLYEIIKMDHSYSDIISIL